MAQKAKAGDVGHGVDALHAAQGLAHKVQLGRGGDQGVIAGGGNLLLLEGGAQDADPKGLGQDQYVPGPGPGILQHPVGMDQTQGHQAIDRFDTVYGMSPGYRNARRGADRGAPRQDLANGVRRQLVDGHADNGQGHDRGSAHGVDVRQGVGRRDPAKVEGVIHYGHEEVGGRHQGLGVVQPPDRRVIRAFGPHQQVGEAGRRRHFRQDVLQHSGRDLAAAAAAVGEGGQAHGLGHGGVLAERSAPHTPVRQSGASRSHAPAALC